MRSALLALGSCCWLGCGEPAPAASETPVRAEAPPAPLPGPEHEREEAPPPHVRLALSGDFVLNPRTMEHLGAASAWDAPLAAWAACVDDDDLVLVNLEMPLVDDLVPLDSGAPLGDPSRPRHAPILGGRPELADALARAGVDAVSVANNHAFDQGHAGLARTIAALDRVGIAHAGAARDAEDAYAPALIERGGVRVAIVSVAEALNHHPRAREGEPAMRVARLEPEERVIEALRGARDRADVVVLTVHWMRDFAAGPGASYRRLAARFVEAGADLVVGTGPHVIHPVVRTESARGDAVVAYSLGNLVSGMGHAYRVGHDVPPSLHPANVRPEARDAVLLRVPIALAEGRIAIAPLTAVPFWTRNDIPLAERERRTGGVALVALGDAEGVERDERRPVIAAALGDAVTLADR